MHQAKVTLTRRQTLGLGDKFSHFAPHFVEVHQRSEVHRRVRVTMPQNLALHEVEGDGTFERLFGEYCPNTWCENNARYPREQMNGKVKLASAHPAAVLLRSGNDLVAGRRASLPKRLKRGTWWARLLRNWNRATSKDTRRRNSSTAWKTATARSQRTFSEAEVRSRHRTRTFKIRVHFRSLPRQLLSGEVWYIPQRQKLLAHCHSWLP